MVSGYNEYNLKVIYVTKKRAPTKSGVLFERSRKATLICCNTCAHRQKVERQTK